MLNRTIKYFIKKKIKIYKPEEYLKYEKCEEEENFDFDFTKELNIKLYKKDLVKRNLDEKEKPIPISPTLGPIKVIF